MNKRFEADIEFAKNVMKEKGELRPMFLLFSEKNGTIPIFPMDFNTDAEKNMFCNMFRLAVVKYQAHAYTYLFEAWMVKRNAKDDIDKISGDNPVSAQPDKIEALIVSRNTPDNNEMFSCEIERDSEGKVTGFGEENRMEGVKGRFSDLLPPACFIARELTPEQSAMVDHFMKMFSMEVKLERDQTSDNK